MCKVYKVFIGSNPSLKAEITPIKEMTHYMAIKSRKEGKEESGKEMALPPSPPLRTGLESFPSSGSSRG